MPKPIRPHERGPERPDVIDLKARRRVAELKAATARKSARPSKLPPIANPLLAWALLIAVALAWALVRWLQA